MLAVRRGRWSQAAALAGVAWGLAVWVFGEAFGNVFAPAQSFLTGAPGAALLYVVAGALIALPARTWASARLGRWLLAGSGLFLVGMAVLQAWPGRGFWSGGGPLADMIGEMSGTPQPRPLASLVDSFGRIVWVFPARRTRCARNFGDPSFPSLTRPASSVKNISGAGAA